MGVVTSTHTARLTYRKGDCRYYVAVDGTKVGWVSNLSGEWRFYATTDDSLRGTLLADGYKTRRSAVREGLATLRIRHLGRVIRFNYETCSVETVYIPEATLRELDDRLLDEMYPMPKGTPST